MFTGEDEFVSECSSEDNHRAIEEGGFEDLAILGDSLVDESGGLVAGAATNEMQSLTDERKAEATGRDELITTRIVSQKAWEKEEAS